MFVNRQSRFSALLAALCFIGSPSHAQTASASLNVLAAAAHDHPDSVAAKHALENAVGSGLPETLSTDLIPDLPLESTLIAGNLGTLIVPKPFLITQATEPQHGQTFVKITYLYAPNGTLFCRVHYTTPDDAALAARMARLLALAHHILVAQIGTEARDGDTPFDIWLCRQGKAGGEQWDRNLYFYDLDASRSSIEWIREIVHEYSHLALPPIGGYKDPEYWASGYLGERLIVRWMQRAPGVPALVSQIWGDFSGAPNFDRLLIAPAIALYKKVGPSPTWLARTDADGMRYLIGQALTMDDKYGSHALSEAFALLPREAYAADLTDAFAQVTTHRTTDTHRP